MMLLFAFDCQSVRDCDAKQSDPAPHWSPTPQFNTTTPPSPSSPPPRHQSIHSSMFLPPGFEMFVSSLSPRASLHPSPLRSPQKRLIQEGWAGLWALAACYAPCGAFTVHFCSWAAFMICYDILICWQFRWLSQMLHNYYQQHKTCLFSYFKE